MWPATTATPSVPPCKTLTSRHGLGGPALGKLIQAEVFVDLFTVARNAIQVGAESYSLKVVERSYRLSAQPRAIDKGAYAVVGYENFYD